jgi:hypothetical protein
LSEALRIRLVEDVWVGYSQHHKAQEGSPSGLVGANTFSETSVCMLQATRKPLKSLVVISYPHTKGSVIVLGRQGEMVMLVT